MKLKHLRKEDLLKDRVMMNVFNTLKDQKSKFIIENKVKTDSYSNSMAVAEFKSSSTNINKMD